MPAHIISKEEIEFVARAICITRGVSPDIKVTRNIEVRTKDGLIIPESDLLTFPAWIEYRDAAIQAILAVRQFNASDPRIGDG